MQDAGYGERSQRLSLNRLWHHCDLPIAIKRIQMCVFPHRHLILIARMFHIESLEFSRLTRIVLMEIMMGSDVNDSYSSTELALLCLFDV